MKKGPGTKSTLPSATRTEAKMSSGSPTRPRAGRLRLSLKVSTNRKERSERVGRTVNVHPPLVELYGPADLHLVYALAQPGTYRLMQHIAKPLCRVIENEKKKMSTQNRRIQN